MLLLTVEALETLVTTLQSHLARTTDELSHQRDQLNELQSLRQIDARSLEQRLATIEALKVEVERIGREVETLRGVVEEGLTERKRAKENGASDDTSQGWDATKPPGIERRNTGHPNRVTSEEVHDISRTDIPSPPPSRSSSPKLRQQPRKDRGKLRFTFKTSSEGQDRFINDDELERVSAEVDERRSVRSDSNGSLAPEGDQPSAAGFDNTENADKQNAVTREGRRLRAQRPDKIKPPNHTRQLPAHVRGHEKDAGPFPHIRGRHLEQLFFSAPTHNEQTCRLCHRRQRPDHANDDLDFPSFLPPRKRARLSHDGASSSRRKVYNTNESHGKESRVPFSKDSLPPQTVLARVLSELEDEFSHYKG